MRASYHGPGAVIVANHSRADEVDPDDPSFVAEIGPLIRSTYRSEVIKGVGTLSGMFSLPSEKYRHPVLISAAGGVGAKGAVARMAGSYDTIGIDLVASCVNDVLVRGAEPLFLLDYYTSSQLTRATSLDIVKGLVAGCREAHCTLLGGKTVEASATCSEEGFDLAGVAVGIVAQEKLLDGASIGIGYQLVGIASNGLHLSGYELAMKILFKDNGLTLDSSPEGLEGQTLRAELLRPTRIYVKTILNLIRDFRVGGVFHVGDGGLPKRLTNRLPSTCQAVVRTELLHRPPIYSVLKALGKLTEEEMFRSFNQGVGMVVVVPAVETDDILERLRSLGEEAFRIGEIVRRTEGAQAVRLE